MDIFIEKIVARKKRMSDYLVIIGLLVMGLVAAIAVLSIRQLGVMSILPGGLILYGAYYYSKSRSIEYEYSVTNGELDIDIIIAQRSRKRIFSCHCKEFDIVASVRSDKFNQEIRNIKNRITAVGSRHSPDIYFVALAYKGQRTLVVFEPDQRMLDAFKKYIPKKVFVE